MIYSVRYLQNSLLPRKEEIQKALQGKFKFLTYVSPDILKFVQDPMTDREFMQIVQSDSIL